MIACITTCRRLDLFKRTLVSFKENCLDFDLVNFLLIYDDGSSQLDRNDMIRFCEAIGIRASMIEAMARKGHSENLNAALSAIGAASSKEFVLMLEDDWTLSHKGCFLMAAKDVLINNPSVGQVCLGRKSAFDCDHTVTNTPTGTDFTILPAFNDHARYCPFTLNPSVFRVDALRKTGAFESVPNFEYSYGKRFSDLGWRTAHLYPANLEHIGHGRSAYDISGSVR